MRAKILRPLINLWPPLFFNAISVTHISDDFRKIDVKLKLRWYNRNNVRTQFGGNLFAMTDPWYMLMLMENLGRDYYIWDKKATIDFISPGRSHVTATFRVSVEQINAIRTAASSGEKQLPEFIVDILNDQGQLVARVHRTVYIKLKPKK